MKNTFNNFLIKFVEVRSVFRDYQDNIYNIRVNIKYRIYERSYYRLIIKIKIIDNHEIFFDNIEFIIDY